MLRINLVSIFVEDIYKALRFYTEVLGFEEKHVLSDIGYITVISSASGNDIELLLEPNDNPIALTYQKSLFEQGIPSISFGCDDVEAEYRRLKELGVKFHLKPKKAFGALISVFEDGCGNLVQIAEVLDD